MNHKRPKRRCLIGFLLLLILAMAVTGCGERPDGQMQGAEISRIQTETPAEKENPIALTSKITQLEDGFSAVRYDGDYGFDGFLSQGGASSDK